jgi:hypothetical protein
VKYRKKPAVVEASQFRRTEPWPAGVREEDANPPHAGRCYVVTAHGQRAYLEDGDWVITEPDGRGHYPCKDDIFRESFDPVNTPEPAP